MKVLIIPEDFRLDQFVLTPILGRVIRRALGSSTKVDVCRNPVVGGVSEALKIKNIEAIVSMYPMVDMFILCVDRDAELGRQDRLRQIEEAINGKGRKGKLLAEVAIEELEAWILAGLKLPSDWRWIDIRSERDVKEAFFAPYAAARGLSSSPGGGRALLAEEAARNLSRILQLCRDDLGLLTKRLLEHR